MSKCEVIKLGDIFNLKQKSKIKAGEGLTEGKYKFYTSSLEQTKFIEEFQYEKEALIFGTGGNANVHYADTPFSTSTDCLVFYGKDNINLKMIYYYLLGKIEILQNGFKGAGLKHISKDYILKIKINLPDLATQNNIVKEFDLICKLINEREIQIQKLDVLVKSRFYGELEVVA